MKEKIIGILGGMGPEATCDFFANIIQLTPAEKDQNHLHIIIDNNPKIPDRTAFIMADGEDPLPYMVESGRKLEQAGVDFIVIPCISAHYFLDKLKNKLNTPILSVFDEVSKTIKSHDNIYRVGLLATDGTIAGGHFQQKLEEFGLKTIVPDNHLQPDVMKAIYFIKGDPEHKKRAQCQSWLKSVVNHLIKRGVSGIIAGCTEIPLALKAEDLDVPLFDPLKILAKAAVEKCKVN